MKRRFASVLIVATILFAGGAHASINQRQTVTLDRAAIVGGTVLPAGTYRVELSPGLDTAKFVQGNHTLAYTPCKVAPAQVTNPGDAVHYRSWDGSHYLLSKIVFAQWNVEVEFPTAVDLTTDTPAAATAEGL